MNQQLELLNQIIEMAQAQEQELKDLYLKVNKASKTVGETSVLFYLKRLKELMEQQGQIPERLVIDGHGMDVSFGGGCCQGHKRY